MGLTKEGFSGIISPVVTPFDEGEDVDFDAFRSEVRYILGFGVSGLLVGAATGEGYSLTPDESGALYEGAVEEAGGRVPVIAGVLCTSTRDAVARARRAAAAGAAAVLVTPVYYFAPSDEGLFLHYRAVAEDGGLPVVVYNSMPHVPIRPALMEHLADIPGVIGVKEGMGGTLDTLGQLIETVGDRIGVAWAQDSLLFPGFALGAVASLGAMDSVLPGHSVETLRAVQQGDLETARKIHRGVAGVARAAYAASFPAGVKAAINLQGRRAGQPRRPYRTITSAERQGIADALAAAGVSTQVR
ncbi:MAG: dihydrodipicolinate synthase family protein [Actinobacteria bacterium]|nr:dihydrodipicolinate synthase family protein [Actinomycetota bacterium]